MDWPERLSMNIKPCFIAFIRYTSIIFYGYYYHLHGLIFILRTNVRINGQNLFMYFLLKFLDDAFSTIDDHIQLHSN